MSQGSSNPSLNITKLAGTNIAVNTGVVNAGTQRVVIATDQPSIPVQTTQPVYGLSNVNIVGTSGQFSCSELDTTPLIVGQQITITGTLSGTGSISGYTNPKAYIISQTNGATTFTLVTLTGATLTTTTGTTTGLTFFTRGQQDVNIVGNVRENINAISTKLSDGTQKSILRSGAKGTSVSADVTSTSIDVNTQALDVSLKAGTSTIGKLALNDGIDIGDVTINNTFIPVTDNGSSLTVDAPLATPVYVRLSNGTTAVDSVPVTDGGGSLTVDGSVSISNFPTTQPVSGTVTVAQATAANLNATVTGSVSALQSGTWNINSITTFPTAITNDTAAIKTAVQLLDDAVGTDGAVAASGMLRVGGTDGTNNQTLSVTSLGHVNIADGGNSITVDGTVGVSGSVAVTGAFWQATQPVSIATAVPITDNGGSITVDGSVSVSNFPATQAVSIATLPALATGTNTIGSVSFVPNATTTNAPTNASTTAYAASLIAKASAGVLYMITGFNSRSSGQFIQLHDSATLPADASVPKVVFYVEANSNFSLDLGTYGRAFSNGIVICNSSSGPTKTIGAADCWFDIQYK